MALRVSHKTLKSRDAKERKLRKTCWRWYGRKMMKLSSPCCRREKVGGLSSSSKIQVLGREKGAINWSFQRHRGEPKRQMGQHACCITKEGCLGLEGGKAGGRALAWREDPLYSWQCEKEGENVLAFCLGNGGVGVAGMLRGDGLNRYSKVWPAYAGKRESPCLSFDRLKKKIMSTPLRKFKTGEN